MKWLLIPAAVLAVLWLLGQLRLGAGGEYGAEGLRVWLRAGPLGINVFPRKKKKKEKKAPPKKEKEKKPKPAHEPDRPAPGLAERAGGALDYARALLPILLEGAGQFKDKLQVDKLTLEVTVGSSDPAQAALNYGRASAALAGAWGALNEAFRLKEGEARVRVDFDARETKVYGYLALSLKLGQLVWLGIYFGCRALGAFLRTRSRRKQEHQQRKAA